MVIVPSSLCWLGSSQVYSCDAGSSTAAVSLTPDAEERRPSISRRNDVDKYLSALPWFGPKRIVDINIRKGCFTGAPQPLRFVSNFSETVFYKSAKCFSLCISVLQKWISKILQNIFHWYCPYFWARLSVGEELIGLKFICCEACKPS